jgi:hypothetical protein
MHDEYDDIDSVGLARARWLCLVDALLDALRNLESEDYDKLSRQIEIEMGLRHVVPPFEREKYFTPVTYWELKFKRYGEDHEDFFPVLVPRMEFALATQPTRWLAYVQELGRACFDPAELSACAAVAKNHAEGLPAYVSVGIIQILHWSWDCVLGRRPVPCVREVPRRGHPTIVLEIIGGVERIETNWKSLGLTPVVNAETVVRWDEHERWTAWIKLVRTKTGKITTTAALRLRSDGLWRIVRHANSQ